MRLFDFFAQLDVLEIVRPDNHRKIYIGPGNEIIYHIHSQTQSARSGEAGVISKVLFSAKKSSGLNADEDSDESHGCCSKMWKNFIGYFFNKCDRMNPQIVENARNVIDRRKDDEKENLDIGTFANRIEKLESTIGALSKKLEVIVKSEY